MELIQALLTTVLPVFALAGLGVIARTRLGVEVRDPARIAMYILSPGLILNSIVTSSMGAGEVGKIILFSLLLTAGMAVVTLLTARLSGWSPTQGSAAVLSTAFMNSANYGLPVVLLALGQEGFERAAIFVVVEAVLMYTVAVFFAARGRLDWHRSLGAVARLPLIWAALAGLVIRASGVALPQSVLRPLGLLGNGAIVMVLLLLGMQVAGIRLKGARLKIGVLALLRLVLSPVLGLALVWLLRPDPMTAGVLVLEAAMPTAVNATLIAVEFEAEPDLVSGVTLVSTLASLVTLSFWVWFVRL